MQQTDKIERRYRYPHSETKCQSNFKSKMIMLINHSQVDSTSPLLQKQNYTPTYRHFIEFALLVYQNNLKNNK